MIEDLSGSSLGAYELIEKLGAGGMGVVYRGYQSSLNRDVAVKVLPPTLALSAGYVERFNREAQTAASLEHKHIVPIYDYGTQRGASYIVMRLLTGGSLEERIRQRAGHRNPLPSLEETAKLLDQVASALNYAHRREVVHRDIKPSNVMFDDEGDAYVADFGIAKLLGATSALTGTGMSLGTPNYMAPEQWRGEDISPATDQYALGALAYVLVTGRPPFDATTPYALMHKHLKEIPTPPHEWRPGAPPAIRPVLERAMAKQPEDRYPTVTDFSHAFSQAVGGTQEESTQFYTFRLRGSAATRTDSGVYGASRPSTAGRRRQPFYRNPWVVAVGIAIVALTVLLLAVIFTPTDEGGPSTPTPDEAQVLRQTLTAISEANTPTLSEAEALRLTLTAVSSQATAPPQEIEATVTDVVIILPTDTALPSPTVTSTATPEPTATPTASATSTATATLTETPSATPTVTSTPTATATATRTYTPTPSPTNTPTAVPTATPTPEPSPTPFSAEDVETAVALTLVASAPSPTPFSPEDIETAVALTLAAGEAVPAEDKPTDFVPANCEENGEEHQTVEEGAEIILYWHWVAETGAQIEEHVEHVEYEITLDGRPIDWLKAETRDMYEGNMSRYWYLSLGNLPEGTYQVDYRITWDEPITDGFTEYGPGTDNEVLEYGCTFTVE